MRVASESSIHEHSWRRRVGGLALSLLALGACGRETGANASSPQGPTPDLGPSVVEPGAPAGGVDPLTRDEVPLDETWNLADVYVDDAAWARAKRAVEGRIPALRAMEARFGRSAEDMLAVLTAIDEVGQQLDRVWLYAELRADQDTRDAEGQALLQQLDVLFADFATATAWLSPAVVALGPAKIDAYLRQQKGLAPYRWPLLEILRQAPHTLSPEAEKVLADSSLIADSAYDIHTIFTNADLQFPSVRLSTGEEIELDQAAYTRYRQAPDREDRKKVFEAFWQVYRDHSRTLGVMLDAGVKRDVFQARARNYGSSLESVLDDDAIPVAVYTNVIAQARENLPTLHRYLELRARLLGIDELAYYDLYVPLVEAVDLELEYAEAKTLVQEGLAPLGPEYQQTLATALGSRWISTPTSGPTSRTSTTNSTCTSTSRA